jgi:hypothetical protein
VPSAQCAGLHFRPVGAGGGLRWRMGVDIVVVVVVVVMVAGIVVVIIVAIAVVVGIGLVLGIGMQVFLAQGMVTGRPGRRHAGHAQRPELDLRYLIVYLMTCMVNYRLP